MCRLYESVKEPKCHRLLVSADCKRLPQSAICHVSGHPSHLSHPAKLDRTRTGHSGFLSSLAYIRQVAQWHVPDWQKVSDFEGLTVLACDYVKNVFIFLSQFLLLSGLQGMLEPFPAVLSEGRVTPWTSRLFMKGAAKTTINTDTFWQFRVAALHN